jgi:thiosulfate/3-mercaptopyruvate sulfurtransferase
MIPMIRRLVLCVALLVAATPAFAQNAVPVLVDVEWLSQHLSDRGLVILHRGRDYATAHIPGARDLGQAPATVASLAAAGVSNDSHVVLYSVGAEIPAMLMFELDRLGIGPRVSMLNGGLGAWTRAGKPVTTQVPSVTPGLLTVTANPGAAVDAEFVKSLGTRPNHRLVDARAPVFYQGIEGMHGKAGHIPGAVNIPYNEIGDQQGVIDRARIERLFRDAGIRPGDTVVAYCHIGQQGRWVVLAARILGHRAYLYEGSFHDWTSNDRGPVVK